MASRGGKDSLQLQLGDVRSPFPRCPSPPTDAPARSQLDLTSSDAIELDGLEEELKLYETHEARRGVGFQAHWVL